MNFISVRGNSPAVNFTGALFNGLAPDGGLYVPESFPILDASLTGGTGVSLPATGAAIAGLFIDEFSPEVLAGITEAAWQFPVPLKQLDDHLFVLELFHGPTYAFKDVGAKFMAGAMSHVLKEQQREVTILVATSGDTGSAVANGFFGAPNIRVFVLFPSGQVSPLQERQMTTLGGNVHALEVAGTFDDCQRMVKHAFADKELSERCGLTTANSINVARLIPQISYYGWGIQQLRAQIGAAFVPPMMIVPSGNFGNLTAGVYAKAIGFPIEHFIAATNANDVVPHYLESGIFEPKPSKRTYSNAMDVGDPSNLARLQHYFGTAEHMSEQIAGVSIDDPETLLTIGKMYERYNYLADPHTAVGLAAAERALKLRADDQPVIVVATAHPVKFREVIKKALGFEVPVPSRLAKMLKRDTFSTKIAADDGVLKEMMLG